MATNDTTAKLPKRLDVTTFGDAGWTMHTPVKEEPVFVVAQQADAPGRHDVPREIAHRYNAHSARVKAHKVLARKLQDASNAYNAECQEGEPSVAVIDAMRDALDSAAATLAIDTPEAS